MVINDPSYFIGVLTFIEAKSGFTYRHGFLVSWFANNTFTP
jgi:hypothetical protein